ncbi:unnamed protein product [Dracunculus medinensis]|uniref:PHD finger protein 10 n=1 Tax=Dracunculus medinensis TaxID=318479 RepID=A0A0N4U287_DRAME|nr:unnamed protein product [Dracunculus medinensis]
MKDQKEAQCSICGVENEDPLLSCSSCCLSMHPDCVDLPKRVIDVALGYDWNCIECKKCIICSKPDDEDSMLFCDRCDRGFHTFCVGLTSTPKGSWICTVYCSDYAVNENLKNTLDECIARHKSTRKKSINCGDNLLK